MAQKLAEKWIGGPLPNYSTIDMEFGKILEEYAIPFYEFRYNQPITRVGLVLTDDGKVGASPDGLLGDDGGIEIKSPRAETHVKYLLNGQVPKDYLLQIHCALYVTGRKWWKFMSYHRRFPELVLTVERDEAIQAKIHHNLTIFLEALDDQWEKLCEINGGPPERRPVVRQPIPEPDSVELIP